ncbi:unnamed protein product [Boreogadus saida]
MKVEISSDDFIRLSELSCNSRLTSSTPLCLLTNPRLSDLLPAVRSLSVCLLLAARLLIHLPDFLLSNLRLPDLPPDVESLSVCLLSSPRLPICSSALPFLTPHLLTHR